MKWLKLYGEDGDAESETIKRELPTLRSLGQSSAPSELWNADETDINYVMPPDPTICQQAIPGRKMVKRHLTLLVCANADGNEKISLFTIKNAISPRCFRNRTGRKLAFEYEAIVIV